MRKRCASIAIILVSFCSNTSQITLHFEKHAITGEHNNVVYYTGHSKSRNIEKVLIFIRGTGRFHASHDFGMGAESTLFGFSLIYPDKSFVDDEKEYFIHDNRQQRLHDIKTIIDDLLASGTKSILLLADSEGTMFAPEIARLYKNNICGLVCMGGSVSSFRNNLLYLASNHKGNFVMDNTQNLQRQFDEILSDPNNVKKAYLGHAYRFWSSYLLYQSKNDLKQLSCPILYLNGENDNLDINLQQVEIKNLNNNGVDIEQIVYPGIGHELKPVGKKISQDIFSWALKKKIIVSK